MPHIVLKCGSRCPSAGVRHVAITGAKGISQQESSNTSVLLSGITKAERLGFAEELNSHARRRLCRVIFHSGGSLCPPVMTAMCPALSR
jgi:hypothetical protein